MENSIAYWVGVAESALEEFEIATQIYAREVANKAKAAHKDAMENLMRIAQESLIYFPTTAETFAVDKNRGRGKGPQALLDNAAKLGYTWSDELETFIYTRSISEEAKTELRNDGE